MDRLPRRAGPARHLRGHAGDLQLSGAETIHQEHDQGEETQVWRRQHPQQGRQCLQVDQSAVADVGPSSRFGLKTLWFRFRVCEEIVAAVVKTYLRGCLHLLLLVQEINDFAVNKG